MDNKTNVGFRQLLFKEGAPAQKLYLIKSGEILCLKSTNDRLIPIYLAKKGDMVGESAMMEDSHYTYSAITLAESELIEIPSLNFRKALQSAPEWLVGLTGTMITRYQNTANLVAENRMVHPSIISEEIFTPSLEVEFKKLLN